jgi:hypothetical protein
MHSFADSEAVRQSIHEREDVYPVVQDFADLLRRGSLALLKRPRIVRHAVGRKSDKDSVRPGIAGDFRSAPTAFSSAGRSNRPNVRRTASSGPSPNYVW